MKKHPKVTIVNPPQPPTAGQQAMETLKQLGWIVVIVIVVLVVGTAINKTSTKLTRDYWNWAEKR